MGAVLRVGVTEHPRQAPHRATYRHGAVTAPHDVLALLAETPFLRAAGQLIPNHSTPPNPSGPLEGIGDGGILPPVNKQADGRSRLTGFPGVGQPLGHPSRPAALIPVVPIKIRQGVFRIHAAVFLEGGAVFLAGLPAAGRIGRVGDESVERLGLESPNHLQGVPVQDRPALPAAVFQFQKGSGHHTVKGLLFLQRHLPFSLYFRIYLASPRCRFWAGISFCSAYSCR